MDITKLSAVKREKAGKGASRANRKNGFVPAVIYGAKEKPVLISITEKNLLTQMNIKGIWTRQFSIDVEGQNFATLCQDIQKHPISGRPIHADFLHITKSSIVTMDIPLEFINEDVCPGIKLGGVLNIVHRTVAVKCRADSIPQSFVIDLANVNAGDSVLSSTLALPQGVTLHQTEEFTLATIVQATQETVEDKPVETAAATPEAEPAKTNTKG